MQDSRIKRVRKNVCQLKAFRFQSVEATTTAHVPSQPGPGKASALSVILARRWALDWALQVMRQIGRSVSFHEISCGLLLLLCPCFDDCCHDPFIVRSTQTCPPFLVFTQFMHPSRCSRSTLTTVCFGFCSCVCFLCLRVCRLGAISIIGSHRVCRVLHRDCNPSPHPS